MKFIAVVMLTLGGALVACSSGNVFSLEVGQCFDDPESFGQVSDVEIVDCAQPHDNEVFHLFDLAGDSFPGQSEAQDLGQQGCLEQFQSYVGRDYPSSSLVIGALSPSAQSWEKDDREVVCFLYDGNLAKLTGTARNSGL